MTGTGVSSAMLETKNKSEFEIWCGKCKNAKAESDAQKKKIEELIAALQLHQQVTDDVLQSGGAASI